MRTLLLCLTLFFSFAAVAQHETKKNITISENQKDDIYYAGEEININARVDGDAVLAGSKVTIRDTIQQDLMVAGGEITVKGYVVDDIRAAGGKLIIDSEIGDDLIVAGGEVLITKNAIIRGNLINFSGDLQMNGKVDGFMKSYSGDLKITGSIGKDVLFYGEEISIDGEIKGASKLIAETILVGEKASFNGDVTYWSQGGKVDFKKALGDANANFDTSLKEGRDSFSLKGLGIAILGICVFYLFSAFLTILLLNWAFGNFLSTAAYYMDKNFLTSLGYGSVYLIGTPILILIAFVIVIGIPIGLFLGGFYIFSLLFGHIVMALIIAYYFSKRWEKQWDFWMIGLLGLAIAAVIRIVTFIPFLGAFLSFVVIAVGYGLVAYTLLQKKAALRFGN